MPNAYLLRNLAAGALVALLLSGCGGSENDGSRSKDREEDGAAAAVSPAAAYTDITVERLRQLQQEEHDALLVNVHVPYAGDIPGTDLRIPFDEITERAAEIGAPDAPIILYCRSGSMSAQAAADLAAIGYTDVYNLTGGMKAWQEAGFTLDPDPAGVPSGRAQQD